MSDKARIVARTLAGVLACLAAATARADWALNMPRGVTEISAEVYELHMLIFWVCVAIGVVVFSAMVVSIFLHRKSRGVQAAQFTHSTQVEVAWTIIPFVILVAMAIPAAETLVKMEDTRAADMTVKVTGYQWRWRYDYLDEDIGFFSSLARSSNEARLLGSGIDPFTVENYLLEVDEPLVVPVGRKVRLLLTAADVLHAWWVPQLGMKRDAIPGFINELWFNIEKPGTYRGQCTELCGQDHGFMPIVVEAVSEQQYADWVASRKPESRQATGDPAPETEQRGDLMAARLEGEIR